MFLKLNKVSYIRLFSDYTYLVNRITNNEIILSKEAYIFLEKINKEIKSMKKIVEEIKNEYIDIPLDIIEKDFENLINKLSEEGFLVLGKSILDVKEEEEKLINYYKENKQKNLDNEINKYLDNYFTNKPHLMNAMIELTTSCNERCVHCYHPDWKNVFLDKEVVKKFLREAKDLGCLNVSFTGGEPFLHKDIKEILEYAHELDLVIAILTNGTLITEEKVKLLKELEIDSIQLSIYSLDPDIHDSITQIPGSLKKTMKALSLLMENEIYVIVSAPIMRKNINCISKVKKWAEENKLDFRTDYDLIRKFSSENENSMKILKSQYSEVINLYDYRNNNDSFKGKESSFNKERSVCSAGKNAITLGSDGNYYSCMTLKRKDLIVGNVKDKTLEYHWNNSEVLKGLRRLKTANLTKCKNCNYSKLCKICLAKCENLKEFIEDKTDNITFYKEACTFVEELGEAIT